MNALCSRCCCLRRRRFGRADSSLAGQLLTDAVGDLPARSVDLERGRGDRGCELPFCDGRPSVSALPAEFPLKYEDNNFKLGDFIGLGGQAYVFTCIQTGKDKECAAKVFDLQKLRLCERDPIECEIEALKRLKHPNIVEYVGSFQVNNWRFIVMELITGGDLHNQVFEQGRLNELEARYVFRQLLGAVGYIHSFGMIHRDLKLKNVLISSRSVLRPSGVLETDVMQSGTLCELKLIDFGFCGNNPKAHTRVGTDLFVAPEVTEQKYDCAADFWSLGVLLFTCLCAHHPYDDPYGLGVKLEVLVEVGRLPDPHSSSPWFRLSTEAKSLLRGLLTVEWDRWYGPKSRLILEDCLRHPWVDKKQPPEWSPAPMQDPPYSETLHEISVQKVQVTREEAHNCLLGSVEEAMKAVPFFDESYGDKCLDLEGRFGAQVVQVRRWTEEEAEPKLFERPEPKLVLQKGDWVFYGCRKTQPVAGQPLSASGSLAVHGELEKLFTEDRANVKPVTMDCFVLEVPEAWNNCVLGGAAQASEGQGFLDIRNGGSRMTVVGIVPGPESPQQSTILFPGKKDVVHQGDKLLFPRRFKDVASDATPFPEKERQAREDAERRLSRGVASRFLTDKATFEKLCAEGHAKRADS